MSTIMRCWAGIVELCLLNVFVICCIVSLVEVHVKAQNHQWVFNYTSCSKPCGGGVQQLNKFCYTIEGAASKPAFNSYCNQLPITEPLVKLCNTQSCTLCERQFTTLSGLITSPYYPNKVTLSKHCRLSIKLPVDKRVVLAFKEFVLEGVYPGFGPTEEDICICGTICVLSDPNFELIKDELCGTKPPFVWMSQSNEALIEFFTESNSIFNRFKANYTTINKPLGCYTFIDITNDAPSGFLTSLKYPNSYPDSLDCEYVLQANPFHRIVLFFETLKLEPSTNCHNDYVKVSDLYTWRSDVYCDTQHSFAWVSDSNAIWIFFHTNDAYVYEGFLIAYEIMDRDYYPLVFTDFPGQIASPGYPISYPPMTKFEYLIHAKPSKMIIITFNEFHLEAPHTIDDETVALCEEFGFTADNIKHCLKLIKSSGKICGGRGSLPCTEDTAQDFVEILDVYFNENAMFCGHLPSFSWFSRGSEVLLRFFTDENENFQGFQASYRTLDRRPPADWEIVFRVVTGQKPNGVGNKWLDTTRGYNENNFQAQSTVINGFNQVYKNSIVNDWEDISVKKVKVQLYTKGSVVSTFIFEASDSRNLTDWFTCENLIYSPYTNLENCTDLVFRIDDQGFKIANELGANGATCNDDNGLLWLDIQDMLEYKTRGLDFQERYMALKCAYEDSAKTGAKFFYSTEPSGTPTKTGAYLKDAEVFTIWLERDSDQFLKPTTTEPETIKSRGFGNSNYPHNEHYDIYVATNPNERISFTLSQFILQMDCERDYVEIEDFSRSYSERFCGKQSDVEWTTSGNAAVFRFRTDPSISYLGFKATVSAEEQYTEDCSSIIYMPWGNITNLHYPSSPHEFRHQGCETLIHSHPDERVILTFDSFLFEIDNSPEFVILDTFGNDFLVPISGKLYPFSWTSASNELGTWYYPQPYQSHIRFSARPKSLGQPKPAGCLEFYDGEFYGTFLWPMLSMPTGSQNCFVIVRTQPVLNRRVKLQFNNLVLQLQDCNSYVQAKDTTTNRSDMYCTTTRLPFTWTSDANEVIVKCYHGPEPALHQVIVEYDSLQRVNPKCLKRSETYLLAHIGWIEHGSSNNWTSLEFENIVQVTGRAQYFQTRGYKVLVEEKSYFSSPNYPHLYASNVPLVEFLLHAKSHQFVIVVFTDFGVEGPDGNGVCQYDFVRVYDLLDERENRFCGDQPPFGWTSTGNEVLVMLVTDNTAQYRGFYANYGFLTRPDPATCGGLFTRDTGNFFSPNYPRSYGNNQLCVYVIQAPPNKRIIIELTQLALEQDINCQKDSLTVKDKISGRKEVFCGQETVPIEFSSWGNVVVLIFVSDLSNSKFSGFAGNYEIVDRDDTETCVQEFFQESGTFRSPRFPDCYYNNADCRYQITVGPDYAIQLSFKEFILEPPDPLTSNCDFDYVEIIGAPATTGDRICGSKAPFDRRVSSNDVTILFHSDFISFYKGFVVDYQQVDLTTPPPSCDQEFTAPSGVFTSPNYPGNYPENTECHIRINVDDNLRIKITFTDFSLESHVDCPYDYVKVSDVQEGLQEKYCGRATGPILWESQSHQVLVLFHSDDRTPSSGFRAIYETEVKPVAPSPFTGCTSGGTVETEEPFGQLASPKYPLPYELNIDCRVRIILRPGYVCAITFLEFELEEHTQCSYDYVELTSFPDDTSKRFCGRPYVPLGWKSNGHICEVHFHSDSYVTAAGYRASYVSLAASKPPTSASKCNQELGGTSGSFATPNYPDNYPNNADCVTQIWVPSGYVIEITFSTFDVEDEPDCKWDYVQIEDVNGGTTSPHYCGNYKKSFMYTSVSNKVKVIFFSDNWENRKGYLANYDATISQK